MAKADKYMNLSDYMVSVAEEMKLKSDRIRKGFYTHHPSAGGNREDLVKSFLLDHLPQKFTITSGLIFSSEGLFSREADLIIADGFNNAPLFAKQSKQLWPVESVYAVVEVKTSLSNSTLRDSIEKCRKFKKLSREFYDGHPIRNKDSLFTIWAYSAPKTLTLRKNLEAFLSNIPVSEQPDMIVVPGQTVITSGTYRQVATLGQPGSSYRIELEQQYGTDLSALINGLIDVHDGQNSLYAWYLWLDVWLRTSDERLVNPLKYVHID